MLWLNQRGGQVVEGYGVVGAQLGPRIETLMEDYLEIPGELA
jgi:hypothetical protein